METYEVTFKPSAWKELQKIPKPFAEQIMDRIQALSLNPRPPRCKQLFGQERYRIRQGDYRILYEVIDKRLRIFVVKVGHRSEVYDDES